MKNKRRIHSAEFKARVALEAMKGIKTVQEIAPDNQVHPTQVTQWNKVRLGDRQLVKTADICKRLLHILTICTVSWERFRSVLVEADVALRVVACYIDLNPVRAGLVADPKEYRWCGYAEAVAGVKQSREAIAFAMLGFTTSLSSIAKRLAAYRCQLFEAGGISTGNEASGKKRRGFSAGQIESVRMAGGKLGVGEALHCRVRHFTEGLVLGSVEFVETYFQRYRHCFGAYRASGARPIECMAAFDLHSF
jgi:transposase-like protein